MDKYLSDYMTDPRSTLLSLQLLDQVVERPSENISDHEYHQYQHQYPNQKTGEQHYEQIAYHQSYHQLYKDQYNKYGYQYENNQYRCQVDKFGAGLKQNQIMYQNKYQHQHEACQENLEQNYHQNYYQKQQGQPQYKTQAQNFHPSTIKNTQFQKQLQIQFQQNQNYSQPKPNKQISSNYYYPYQNNLHTSQATNLSNRQQKIDIQCKNLFNNYANPNNANNISQKQVQSYYNFNNQNKTQQHCQTRSPSQYQSNSQNNSQEQSRIYILENLDSSRNRSRIKQQPRESQNSNYQNIEAYPQTTKCSAHNQLALLKQLQQKARATINETQYAEQVKQNFQVLFQRVYGIIQEIQHRNQKHQGNKTIQVNSNNNTNSKPNLYSSRSQSRVKQFGKKQLTMNTRVIQLSVGKQNQKLKKKKFCNVQTQFDFDYNVEAFDQDYISKGYLKTQQCIPTRTPCGSASKKINTNLLTLSKQYPYIASPRAHVGLDSARSEKSSKSKGITLVSLQRKPELKKDQSQKFQTKKPVKITLMQKKIVLGSKKKNQTINHPKTDNKKTSAFNPNNFFNSRRVSGRIV